MHAVDLPNMCAINYSKQFLHFKIYLPKFILAQVFSRTSLFNAAGILLIYCMHEESSYCLSFLGDHEAAWYQDGVSIIDVCSLLDLCLILAVLSLSGT